MPQVTLEQAINASSPSSKGGYDYLIVGDRKSVV